MNKIEIKIENLLEELTNFYDEKTHHFMTINLVNIDETQVELQWIFREYTSSKTFTFFTQTSKDTLIPSITSLVPSATLAQRELVDIFEINIENTSKGLYIDENDTESISMGCAL
jgi:ech hydrogenase subunit D